MQIHFFFIWLRYDLLIVGVSAAQRKFHAAGTFRECSGWFSSAGLVRLSQRRLSQRRAAAEPAAAEPSWLSIASRRRPSWFLSGVERHKCPEVLNRIIVEKNNNRQAYIAGCIV